MNLTIRHACIGIVALNAVAAICLVASWMFYSHQQEAVTAAQKSRYESYLLADELRQSSDDLTRLARTYVVTGDPSYEAQYLDVVAIRSGEKPRRCSTAASIGISSRPASARRARPTRRSRYWT